MCSVTQSSSSSLASVSLCFRSHVLLSTLSSQFSCCTGSFPVAILSRMFSLYSHGILGVVFTHSVGYSRPTTAERSNCNKVNEFRKSCLEEVSQLLVCQVALINQYLARLHGDFRRNKESTMILASSTKKKNFVPIVGFVQLLLLFLSAAAR